MDMPSAKAELLEYFKMHANKVLDNAGVDIIQTAQLLSVPERN